MIALDVSLGLRNLRRTQQRRSPLMRALRFLAVGIALVALTLWSLTLVGVIFIHDVFYGLAQIVIGLGVLAGIGELYTRMVLMYQRPSRSLSSASQVSNWLIMTNLADYCVPDVAAALLAARSGTNFEMDAFVKSMLVQPSAQSLLSRAGVVGLPNQDGVAPVLTQPVTDVEAILNHAAVAAVEHGHEQIETSDVLRALLEYNQMVANLCFAHGVQAADLEAAIAWLERFERSQQPRFFWQQGRVGSYGIGRDWAAGYTPTLARYAVDLSEFLRGGNLGTYIIGRTAEINQIETVLSGAQQTNVLLVGPAGIGKKTIVNGLAARIASGEAARPLADKHIFELDVPQLLAGATDPGVIETRLLAVLRDATEAGNIILFVNHLENLLSSDSSRVGSVNAAQVLLPFLQSNRLMIIGATDPRTFNETIAREAAIAQAFSRIDVVEPSPAETIQILENVALHIEARSNVFISIPVIRTAVHEADRYLHDEPRPENAIKLLEAAALQAAKRTDHVVNVQDVERSVSERARVPVGEVQKTEKDRLLNLEAVLHERVIGQDEAIAAVANAIRRARSGLAGGKRPLASFLFLGPTGVGKTETAHALAAAYFGAETAMIRLDMSEYQNPEALAQLIGAPISSQAASAGTLTSAVRNHPFSLILLDEIEKAHPNVLNIFLQILDEGRVTDGRGETADFTNTMIIATSNAGSEFIRQQVAAGQAMADLQEKLLDTVQTQGIFRPEFLNRFDAVVAYKPLTAVELAAIVDLQLTGLNTRLKEEQVTVVLTPAAKAKLAEAGYQPEFGARALRRVMQTAVEDVVAQRLLQGLVQRGQTITLDVTDIHLGGQ